jgi:isoleucyl-tRNA synthetase
LMAPILSFTASEAWDALKGRDRNADLSGSIFFTDFPEPNENHFLDKAIEEEWSKLVKIRAEITRALEKARADKVIGHPLEAEVLICVEGPLLTFVSAHERRLKELSIVSALRLIERDQFGDAEPAKSEEIEGLLLAVQPAAGDKCERCWIRSESVGRMEHHPTICSRCFEVVDALNPDG